MSVETDRSIAPEIRRITDLTIPTPAPIDNLHGAPVFVVENDSEELVKIEFVFPAGTGEETKALLATATSSMLKEGAGEFSSTEISEIKEYYGAKIQLGVGKDLASVSLICLPANLKNLVPLLAKIIQEPNFPEKEFTGYKRRTRARLKVNLEKVEIRCRLAFSRAFFGANKYAERYDPEAFDQLMRKDLVDFHRANYALSDASVFVSGNGTKEALEFLKLHVQPDEGRVNLSAIGDFSPSRITQFQRKEGALQSAIRMGMPAPSRQHKDYPAFYLTNTILGGYFGSRLMQNIREDKGYTYGIGSGINQLKDLAFLLISTQVGAKHTHATLSEIRYEIDRLRTELVLYDELDLVKNYTAGSLLRSFDGTFNQASLLKTMHIHRLSESYYREFLTKIYAVEPADILRIATTYFDPDKFTVAIVGEGFSDNE